MVKTDHRIPVISDASELNIPWRTLQTIIAGKSLIDISELNINSLGEAHKFLRAYGLERMEDAEGLLKIAREYIDTVLLKDSSINLPEEMSNISAPELLVNASTSARSKSTEWSCVILKVCHAIAHAQWSSDEDAYNSALIKVKERLLPFLIESKDGTWIGDNKCRIPIIDYSFKSGKKLFRIVTKLLLKKGNLSAGIYDYIGVRFVVHDIFSAILLIKFLRSRHVFMYANLVPHESKNSIAEFSQIEMLFSKFSVPVQHSLKGQVVGIEQRNKNPYSSTDFKMIKIVERLLVRSKTGGNIFFPSEFQILTQQTYDSLGEELASHGSYEKNQIEGVKNRLFNRTSLLAEVCA